MPHDRTPKRPGDYAIEQIETIKPIAKLLGIFSKDIRKKFFEVEQQLAEVKQAMANRDLFVKVYSPLGWVIYDGLSTDIVAKALSIPEGGESFLVAYHLDPDNLSFLGNRFGISHYKPWETLYARAVERAAAADYLSSVPLLLSIVDGICLTSTGKHPFSGGADQPVFDSETCGPGGLQEGLALFGSTRRKLDIESISIPFRHGIVHGLNPNYGSPDVTAKAFNLLQATIDYFDRRRDEAWRLARAAEEQKPVDIRELSQNLSRTAETRRAIDEWRARPALQEASIATSGFPPKLPPESPEAFAAEYLNLLIAKNYGVLARATVDFAERPIAYRAGRLRDDVKEITVTRWTIIKIEDTAAATTRVTTRLEGLIHGRTWAGEHTMRLVFADENYEAMVRGQSGGAWFVMPDFLASLWLVIVRPSDSA